MRGDSAKGYLVVRCTNIIIWKIVSKSHFQIIILPISYLLQISTKNNRWMVEYKSWSYHYMIICSHGIWILLTVCFTRYFSFLMQCCNVSSNFVNQRKNVIHLDRKIIVILFNGKFAYIVVHSNSSFIRKLFIILYIIKKVRKVRMSMHIYGPSIFLIYP